jgi:hypothetical protein
VPGGLCCGRVLRSAGYGSARAIALVLCLYVLLVLSVWSPFALHSGMPYETGWVVTSETSPLGGFFFFGDLTHLYLPAFFHTSYLLGEIFAPGSFVPFQIVYAILWVARGFLLFLIVRQLLPAATQAAFVAGALTVIHSSDHALQWVGQLHHFSYIFWMLLAWYLFIVAVDARRRAATGLLLTGAAVSQHLQLWTYESGLFLLLLMPVATLVFRWPEKKRVLRLSAAWYVVPTLYCCYAVFNYLHVGVGDYKTTVLRSNVTVSSALNDLVFNMASSVAFWKWHREPALSNPILAAIAATIFVLGWLALRRDSPGWQRRDAAAVLAMGAVWLPLSFPAYLLLDSSRSLWRTQMLSGPGAAMLLTGSIFLLVRLIPNRRVAETVALTALTAIVYTEAARAIERGATHRRVWEVHRQTMASILRVAPQLAPGTEVVLTNVPKVDPPFADDMWFDMALRLAYPGQPVTGAYWYDDGRPAPGNDYRLAPDKTLALRCDAGGVRILETLPAEACPRDGCPPGYAPARRITGTIPSPRAVRRYLTP